MGHEADENEVLRVELLQIFMQGGAGKSVGETLADDCLVVGLRHLRRDLAAFAIEIEGTDVHFLVSHPTPPTFDGTEDRNGLRNHDEIAFWSQYIDATDAAWLVDDAGQPGGLQAEHFVIAGDLNADPHDGDSTNNPMALLLNHPSVQATPVPTSQGGTEQSALQGAANIDHIGDPAHDTADFSDGQVGNLRLDYTLPSNTLPISDSGVYWPTSDQAGFPWVGTFPFPASDHRLVWVDVQVPQ